MTHVPLDRTLTGRGRRTWVKSSGSAVRPNKARVLIPLSEELYETAVFTDEQRANTGRVTVSPLASYLTLSCLYLGCRNGRVAPRLRHGCKWDMQDKHSVRPLTGVPKPGAIASGTSRAGETELKATSMPLRVSL